MWFTTDLYLIKLAGEDTGGAFTVFEVTAAPQSPPLAHMRHGEDEIYYVLGGEFEFMDDGRTFTAGSGSLVFLRKDRFQKTVGPRARPVMETTWNRASSATKPGDPRNAGATEALLCRRWLGSPRADVGETTSCLPDKLRIVVQCSSDSPERRSIAGALRASSDPRSRASRGDALSRRRRLRAR